ncbi:carbohydrate-binding module family 12 protein [Panus rudis PR-1116 ss-1]|nr:carbohydrate-binding module family 12 protein [Panus rudis PR-1116 ss-1]
MVQYWEPGTQYDYGAVVEYEGHKYKIIQPHRSQSDWTPPLTPALWGRLSDQDHNEGQQQHQYQPQYQQQQPPQPQYNYGAPPQQTGYQPPHLEKPEGQTVDVSHDDRKKKWHELDDDQKKKFEIGGGLLAGAAAVAAGYFAYREHEKSEEEKKANVWALSNWLRDAQERTARFYREGPTAPVTWVLVEGKNIPTEQAIIGGEEGGQPIYICRAFHEGSIQVGKAQPNYKKGGVLGYAHDEIHVDKYEVLLGDKRAVRWVDAHGRLNVQNLGARPVEGGRESDGTPLYIAQAHYHNAITPGKISERLNAAFIPYSGTEKEIKDYRVLCYA